MGKEKKHINECSCGCGGTCSTNVQEATFADVDKELNSFDKYYDRSDDNSVYRRGKNHHEKIMKMIDDLTSAEINKLEKKYGIPLKKSKPQKHDTYKIQQFGKFIVNKDWDDNFVVHKRSVLDPPIKTFGKNEKAAIDYAKKRAGVNESSHDTNTNVKVLKNIYKNHTDKTEQGFYDQMDKIETKMGNQKYRAWLSKIADALDIKYRTHAALEEKLFHIAAGHKVNEKKKLSEQTLNEEIKSDHVLSVFGNEFKKMGYKRESRSHDRWIYYYKEYSLGKLVIAFYEVIDNHRYSISANNKDKYFAYDIYFEPYPKYKKYLFGLIKTNKEIKGKRHYFQTKIDGQTNLWDGFADVLQYKPSATDAYNGKKLQKLLRFIQQDARDAERTVKLITSVEYFESVKPNHTNKVDINEKKKLSESIGIPTVNRIFSNTFKKMGYVPEKTNKLYKQFNTGKLYITFGTASKRYDYGDSLYIHDWYWDIYFTPNPKVKSYIFGIIKKQKLAKDIDIEKSGDLKIDSRTDEKFQIDKYQQMLQKMSESIRQAEQKVKTISKFEYYEHIIKEHSQTFDVDEAGQLWPFAEKKSYAKSWESSRMSNLFKGSLKDMMIVNDSELGDITNDSDTEDYRRLKRGGDSYDTYDMPKHVLGDYSVTKIMYDKGEVDMYADDVPTIDSKNLEK